MAIFGKTDFGPSHFDWINCSVEFVMLKAYCRNKENSDGLVNSNHFVQFCIFSD
jgi:hypothetical protein